MQDTLRRIADELEIRNRIARIAHLADWGDDLDVYLACFTEDAEWNFPIGGRKGHADIRAGAEERRAAGTTGPGANSRHILTTIEVQADGGDTATSHSYFVFLVETDKEPKVFNCGHYADTWVRTDDGWKLKVRDITLG